MLVEPPLSTDPDAPLGDPGGRTSPPTRRDSRVRRWVTTTAMFAGAIVAGLAVVYIALGALRPHAWSGTVFPNASPAAPFDGLTTHDGEPMDLADYSGDVVLLYFGYTYCPDVCPLTLSVASEAIEAMGSDGDRVHLFMVSVDPARDPLDELGRYVEHFDPRFGGIGGPEAAVEQAAALYGIFYELQEPDENGFYLVDHTATLMGIDPNGDLKVLWDPSITADALQSDLEELL